VYYNIYIRKTKGGFMSKALLQVRVSQQEKEFIEAKAKENDYSNVSEFVRHRLIYPQHLDKKRMKDMLYQVNKIGVNLNQLTSKVNTENKIDVEVLQTIKAIEERFEAIINTYKNI
jgi:Arc/MetJ-type ribon-helix-helix transcriptional regulator